MAETARARCHSDMSLGNETHWRSEQGDDHVYTQRKIMLSDDSYISLVFLP